MKATLQIDLDEVRERVREALPLVEVVRRDGIEVRRSGVNRWVCRCPFHEERSGSFVIGGRFPDRGHCFGCGWDGDVFAYWMARRGCEFPVALRELTGMAGIHLPENAGAKGATFKMRERCSRTPERVRAEDDVKPALPRMRMLRDEEIERLARLRGVSVEAVRFAAFTARVVGYADWPQYLGGDGVWRPRSQGCFPSWVVSDGERAVAEYRRLDGERYPRVEGEGIKAWSTAGKNWPVGVNGMGRKGCVLLVEGGPDLLAGWHFVLRWGMAERVHVVCMLGASNRIRESVLPLFRGKRVRIMMDADSVRGDGSAPGLEAAGRWQEQLAGAGASVETFSLYGLTRADGEPVKDVNDLARCGAEVTESGEIREAFCAWEF